MDLQPSPLGLDELFLDDNFSIEILISKTRNKLNLKELRDYLLKHQQDLNQTSLELFNNSYDRFYKLSYIISCLAGPINQLVTTLGTFRKQLVTLCQNHSAYLDALNTKLASLEDTSKNKLLAKRLIVLIERRDKLERQIGNIEWSLGPIDQVNRVSNHLHETEKISYKIKCDLIERLNIQLFHLTNEVRACQPTRDELIPIRKSLESNLEEHQCLFDSWFEATFLKAIDYQDKSFIEFVLRTYKQKDAIRLLDGVWSAKVAKAYFDIVLVEDKNFLENTSHTYSLLNEFMQRQLDTIGQDFVVGSFWRELVNHFEKLEKLFSIQELESFKMHYSETKLFFDKQAIYSRILDQDEIDCNTNKVLSKFNLHGYFEQRLSQIASTVESSLSTQPLSELPEDTGSGYKFKLKICMHIYSLVCRCWSQDIHIDALELEFTQLACRILNRFADWLSKLRLSDFRISGPAPTVNNNPANRQTNFLAKQDAIMRLLIDDCQTLIAQVHEFVAKLAQVEASLTSTRQQMVTDSLSTVSKGLDNVQSLRKLIER